MSKAIERAIEVFPHKEGESEFMYSAIEKLQQLFVIGYEQAEKELGWRSVEEILPKNGVFVFTCSDDNGMPQCLSVSRYDSTTKMWYDMNDECFRVDYWMPCPKIPEE